MSETFFLYANFFLNDRYGKEIDEEYLIAHLKEKVKRGTVVFLGNTFNLADHSFFCDSAYKKFLRISQTYPLLVDYLIKEKSIIFIKGKYDDYEDKELIKMRDNVIININNQTLYITNGYKKGNVKADVICKADSFEAYINENVIHVGTIRPFINHAILDETVLTFNKKWLAKQNKVTIGHINRRNLQNNTIVSDPVKSWSAFLDLVKSAKESIFISTWFIYQTDIIEELMTALKERDKAGVKITIICYDGVPSEMMGLINGVIGQSGKSYNFSKCNLKNLNYISYAKGKFNGMHSKLLVVDSSHIIFSDRNLMSDYYGPNPCYTGLDLHVKDEKLAITVQNYITKINTEEKVEVKHSFNYTDPLKGINDIIPEYVRLIKKAKQVYIANPILVLPDSIINALNENNTETIFITNFYDYISPKIGLMISRNLSLESCSHVNNHKLYGLTNGLTLHHKYMVVKTDNGYITLFGSYNFDIFSEKINSECSITIEDNELGKTLIDYSNSLLKQSKEINLNEACSCL